MGKTNRVLVIGGGAAGMMAAVISARYHAETVILERMNRVGKKLLATGNGRCNFTNTLCHLSRFHGQHPDFAASALRTYDVAHTLQFFDELGIVSKVEANKVFPLCDQASAVLDVLRYEIERLHIQVICEAEVTKIQPNVCGFTITSPGRSYEADQVIIATGGKASPNLGSNGSGYELAKMLGHTVIEPHPALVPIRLNAWFLNHTDGVKWVAKVALCAPHRTMRQESGEILFTDYGISGIPVLQLSRYVAEENATGKQWLRLDLFPDLSEDDIYELLGKRFHYQPLKPLDLSLVGFLHKRLISVVLKESGITDLHKACGETAPQDRRSIARLLKAWEIPVAGTRGWMQAQVTAGGINSAEIHAETMESKIIPHLYFAGEIIDIDGESGGFNLQWAWSSGFTAGMHAAQAGALSSLPL